MTPSTDPIARLVRSCDPREALHPDDPRYIAVDDVRGENLVRDYERALRRADTARPIVRLFAGHRGVGKTSEMFRLKCLLERTEAEGAKVRPFQVTYFDVSDSLDVNDLEFPDLLVYTAGEVQQQLKKTKITGFTASSALLRRAWDDVKGALKPEITSKQVKVGSPFISLAAEIRNRPNARRRLREAIERQSTNLLGAVNDLLRLAVLKLRTAGREGLVLLVDGLDKLVRRPLDDGRSNTHDRLFLDRSEQLAGLTTHVIYTVPISLIYSPVFAQLEQTFGGHVVPVPMIRLRPGKHGEPTPDTPGMRKMREMIEARCRHAGLDIGEVFDRGKTAEYLCRMSGGHPRHLMMFLQAAANAGDSLPITRQGAEKAVNNYAVSLLREVPDGYWPKLRKFAEPQPDIPKDDDHQQMLFLLHVFEYMNAAPWYEVNPVLRTLAKFSASAG